MQIPVKFNDKSYDYVVFVNELDKIETTKKVAIITNSKIAGLWLGEILPKIKARETFIITIPDGEEYKTLKSLEDILEHLFVAKFDRGDKLIAFGGGVVSDIAGFAANIYQRGIDFINIPTTLLAQVDASVGGKTGVNNKFGKNLIGAFHQPIAVYCESKFLSTLAKREFFAGVCEAIKMAIMFDKKLFDFIKKSDLKDNKQLVHLITRCVQIKADIVHQDEKEAGVRAVLNYGHTFAHIIENQTNYKRYLHGEAVAIGINMANLLAFKLGLLSKSELCEIRDLLVNFELPIKYKIQNIDEFYEAFFLDKKSQSQKIKFILPNKIGDFVIRDDIDEDIIKSVLREFQ